MAAVLLSRVAQVASLEAPTATTSIERKSKITKEAGTHCVSPQPKDLPEGWEQAVALNPDHATGTFIYHKY